MNETIRIIPYTKEKITPWIKELARLRIKLFADYPFLYDGDEECEQRYLKKFSDTDGAIIILVFDEDQVIGAATGSLLIHEDPAIIDAIKDSHRTPEEFFCFGEFLLEKAYRRQGIGTTFMRLCKEFAASLGYQSICLYTSLRDENDPRCPEDYRPLDPFWHKGGFVKHPEITCSVDYKEIGEDEASPQKMVFWLLEGKKD